MLTTTEVRALMNENGLTGSKWTNKTAGHRGLDRRVKVYADNTNKSAIRALQEAAGVENVKVIRNRLKHGWMPDSVIVKCTLDPVYRFRSFCSGNSKVVSNHTKRLRELLTIED